MLHAFRTRRNAKRAHASPCLILALAVSNDFNMLRISSFLFNIFLRHICIYPSLRFLRLAQTLEYFPLRISIQLHLYLGRQLATYFLPSTIIFGWFLWLCPKTPQVEWMAPSERTDWFCWENLHESHGNLMQFSEVFTMVFRSILQDQAILELG